MTARTSSGFDIHDIVWVWLAAGCGDIAAGIVHQDIDRAEFSRGGGYRSLDVFDTSQIAENLHCANAVLPGDGTCDVG